MKKIQCNAGKRIGDLENLQNVECVAGSGSCSKLLVISYVYPTWASALVQLAGRSEGAGKYALFRFFFSTDH